MKCRVVACISAVTLVAGAGCSTEGAVQEPASTASTPTRTQTADTRGVEGVEPLPDSAYDTVSRKPMAAAGTFSGVMALDSAGAVLLQTHPEVKDERIFNSTLSIRSPGSDQRVTIPSPRRDQIQQASGAAMNEKWLVWEEKPGTELSIDPWVLYAYERATGKTKEIARAPMIDGREPPPPPGYTEPVLAGDKVFWAQVGGHIDAERSDIYGCEISTCTPTRYAKGAAYPVVVGEDLFVITDDGIAAGARTWERMDIERITITTRKSVVVESVKLRPEQSPGGLAASSRALAWIVKGKPDVTVIRDLGTGHTIRVESELGGAFGYPVATDDIVVWAESMGNSAANVGNYLYRLGDGTLHSLGNMAGLYGVEAAGPFISWRDSQGEALTQADVLVTVARLK